MHLVFSLPTVSLASMSLDGSLAFWGNVVLFLSGTLLAGFFAGCETGLYTVNRVRLRVRSAREPADHLARSLAPQVDRAERTLPSLLLGFNAFSAVAAFGLTAILDAQGFGEVVLVLINLLCITPISFILADTLPKELYRADAERLLYLSAPVMKLWRLLITATGVLPLIEWLAHFLARFVSKTGEPDLDQARTHIHSLLKEGAGSGVISESQLTLLDRAFGLRETEVGDEMVPWSKCFVLNAKWDRTRIDSFLRAHPFSRLPVVDNRGLVVGLVETLDLLLNPKSELAEFIKPATRLTAALPVRDALKRLQSAEARMAVVVENNRPIGLVTWKDLVEPLTGDLQVW
jgi:putative hemolysin